MKELTLYFIKKWWVSILFSIITFILFVIFNKMWLLYLSILTITTITIFRFFEKRWKIGFFSLFILFGIIVTWFVYELINPQRQFQRRYENITEIRRIIGVEIPNFKVKDSKVVHLSDFDFEIEIQSTIEFDNLPDEKLFQKIDSICSLPKPKSPNENSSYFYYSLESIEHCWDKQGDSYWYSRNTDFGKKILHSTDAFFNLSLQKGSKIAKISYGNY